MPSVLPKSKSTLDGHNKVPEGSSSRCSVDLRRRGYRPQMRLAVVLIGLRDAAACAVWRLLSEARVAAIDDCCGCDAATSRAAFRPPRRSCRDYERTLNARSERTEGSVLSERCRWA